jgi:hypothetical protein
MVREGQGRPVVNQLQPYLQVRLGYDGGDDDGYD